MAKAKKPVTVTTVRLEEQFKHVTYDMLMLAMSLRYINESWPKRFENSMYGPNEVAKGAALIKIRSLDGFLYGPYQADDIRFGDFVSAGYCSGPRGTKPPSWFRESVNKYAAHLTKERTIRGVTRPKADHIVKYGKEILKSCEFFVEDCTVNGLKLERRAGRYHAAFLQEWGVVKN